MTLITDGQIDLTLPITDLPIIYWRNIVTTGNVTTDSQHPDFPVTNVANASLGLKWKEDTSDSPRLGPSEIIVNLTGVGPVNYVALAGHNFGTIGATLAIEGFGGGGFGSPEHQDSPGFADWTSEFSPDDDGPIIFMIAEVEGSQISLRIDSSHVTPAELAVLYVGKATVLPEGIQADHTPLPLAIRDNSVLGQSENGSFLGRIELGQWAESQAVIANLSKAWVREELLDFLAFAAEYPFFWAWSPETYPEETAFAWLDNDPMPVFDIDGYASFDMSMKGIV